MSHTMQCLIPKFFLYYRFQVLDPALTFHLMYMDL